MALSLARDPRYGGSRSNVIAAIGFGSSSEDAQPVFGCGADSFFRQFRRKLGSVSQSRYEERRLLLAYRHSGDARDREAVIDRFLPLARSLARRLHRGGEPLEDLEQVAFLALVKAVDAFDPDRGIAFSSFAVPTITGALKRHYRDSGWSVRMPRDLQELALRIDHAQEELTRTLKRVPGTAQIADYLRVSVEQVLEAREANRALHADSLDRPQRDDDGDLTLVDTLGRSDPELGRAFDHTVLESLIDTLEERDRDIVRLYYQDDLTQREIGEQLGYSQMHISRLLRTATARLTTAAVESGAAAA
jgi:RNA polymerase sigma-B factor